MSLDESMWADHYVDEAVYPWNLDQIYPIARTGGNTSGNDEDPTAYPYSLQHIYPVRSDALKEVTLRLPSEYPAMDVCMSRFFSSICESSLMNIQILPSTHGTCIPFTHRRW